MKKKEAKEKVKYKTYAERAKYLSMIIPSYAPYFEAIADFFGRNEIPPKPKKSFIN